MSKLFELINRINSHSNTIASNKPDTPTGPDTVSGESATEQVLGRIFSVPSDSTRVVMFLNDADLKDRYLTNGGEKKIVDAATDEQINAIFQSLNGNQDDSFVFLVGDDFDLSALDKPLIAKRPYAVLFNDPRSTAEKLRSTSDSTQARADLEEIISHKYYVATLNANAIKKANVGALSDREEREEKFNIKKFVTAFPVRAIINSARAEQDEKDKATQALHNRDDDAPDQSSSAPPLTPQELKVASLVAKDARDIFFRVSGSRNNSGWPSTPEGLKELRDKLVKTLTKNHRLNGDTKLIPAVVRAFYNDQVKADHHYHDLIELLKADVNFANLTGGEDDQQDDPTQDDGASDQSADNSTGDQSTDTPPADQSQDNSNKTPDELAADIKARGEDYADQVAKILSRNAPAPAPASTEPELPEELKKEVDRLTKMKNNAISPQVRAKAAADLAKLLHDHEEQKRQQAKGNKKKKR